MDYIQSLQAYFRNMGYPQEAADAYIRATFNQMMQGQQQRPPQPQQPSQQALIDQFMSLNQGQKMAFAQNWLLKNPQYFKKETPAVAPQPVAPANNTPPATAPEKKPEPVPEKKFPVISGDGSISGTSFKSGDGESYSPKVVNGGSYNLLSDKGLGINGKFGTGTDADSTDSLILRETAISFGGRIITYNSRGDLKIDGKDFRAGKNDLDGEIVKKSGRYILTAGDYEITLSASESSGVRLGISGTDIMKDGVAPEGLWGASFDDEKETSRTILAAIQPKDYKISTVRNFDFDDYNNIDAGANPGTEKPAKKPISEEDENLSIWQDSNPRVATALGKVGGGTFQYFGLAMANTADDASWNMTKLNSSSIYNLFSDQEIQVGAKFNSTNSGLNYPREIGFLVDGRVVKINRSSTADTKLSVSVDGTTLAASASNGKASLNAAQTELTVSTTIDGETWSFTVKADSVNSDGIELNISGTGVGNNDVRTSGLWGAFLGSGFFGDAGTNDTDGAGFIRDSVGARTWFDYGDMRDALDSYQLSDYDTEDEGYSVYSGY